MMLALANREKCRSCEHPAMGFYSNIGRIEVCPARSGHCSERLSTPRSESRMLEEAEWAERERCCCWLCYGR